VGHLAKEKIKENKYKQRKQIKRIEKKIIYINKEKGFLRTVRES